MTHNIRPTEVGYVVRRNGAVTHVVERCPDELKETHGNVIALCPVKELTASEVLLAIFNAFEGERR